MLSLESYQCKLVAIFIILLAGSKREKRLLGKMSTCTEFYMSVLREENTSREDYIQQKTQTEAQKLRIKSGASSCSYFMINVQRKSQTERLPLECMWVYSHY